MKKYYTHSFTDDKGRKIFESKDGERLINTDSKYCKVSKNTIATVRDNGEPSNKLNYANNISCVYQVASGDIVVIFKE